MYHPPFHRRILPWIFTITFVAAAPALIFYTAGYRWNPKKEKVERNGTLILSSQPAGARILLNGKDIGDTTPSTIQNVSPGRISIRFEKTGYTPWQKQLDVLPEYVTFANDAWLWRQSTPSPLDLEHATRLAYAPNERLLAALTTLNSTTSLVIWTPSNDQRQTYPLGSSPSRTSFLSWSPDSRSLLIDQLTATDTRSWLLNTRTSHGPIALPTGAYRWDGSRLEGTSNGTLYEINASNDAITQTPLAPKTVDVFGGMIVRHATGTDALVLFQENDPKRGLVLPNGNWRIEALNRSRVILRDGSSWLSIDPSESDPHVIRAVGDILRPFTVRNKTTYLLINGGEIWSWDPTSDPELLLRESGSIADVAWHESGRNIAIAINGTVSMLNLDPRDGRMRSTLATFDEVYDIALVKKTLTIAAKQGDRVGVWTLEIE